MKKEVLLAILFVLITGVGISQSSIYIATPYVVIYEDTIFLASSSPYKAVIDGFVTAPSGEVKILLKKISWSDMGSGRFIVTFSKLGDDLFRIDGTDYVIEDSSLLIDTYSEFILDLSGYSAAVEKKSSF